MNELDPEVFGPLVLDGGHVVVEAGDGVLQGLGVEFSGDR